jgi:hypothetical protein
MRRGDQLAEAIAGERGYFGERLAVDQSRRQLAGDGYRDLDGFAFEPRFDRCECVGRFGEAGRDALERAGDPAAGLDRGVALRLRVAAALCGGFGSASVVACSASVTVASRSLPAAKSTSNRNFAGAPISRSALLRRVSWK